MADLLTPDGAAVISTTDMKLKFGDKAGPAQRRALTRLTLLLNSAATVPIKPLLRRTKGLLAPLPLLTRKVHPTHLPTIRQATTGYLETSSMNGATATRRSAQPLTVQASLPAVHNVPPRKRADRITLNLLPHGKRRKGTRAPDSRRTTLPPT